jgi:hypothetical protein
MYNHLSKLLGKTVERITISKRNDAIELVTTDNTRFMMYHDQDCCESVYLEDVSGDLNDLIGSPILVAESVTNTDAGPKDEYDDSFTWTFYKFATIQGSVTLRWYGTSNGYYSESVEFVQVDKMDEWERNYVPTV